MLEFIIKLLESFLRYVSPAKNEEDFTLIALKADNITARRLLLTVARIMNPDEWSVTYTGHRGACRKDNERNFHCSKYDFCTKEIWTLCIYSNNKLEVMFEITIE